MTYDVIAGVMSGPGTPTLNLANIDVFTSNTNVNMYIQVVLMITTDIWDIRSSIEVNMGKKTLFRFPDLIRFFRVVLHARVMWGAGFESDMPFTHIWVEMSVWHLFINRIVGMMVDMIVRMVKMIRNMPELYFYVKKERIQRRAFGNTAVIRSQFWKKKLCKSTH